MDLKLLQDALALIECGNLSQAAARRNVTQPAFSRRIRALEAWVGAPLVHRGPNRVELSRELLAAEPELRALLTRMTRFRDTFAFTREHSLPLVLTTQHALASEVLPRTFADLSVLHPDISWRVRTLNREDCVSLFLQGDADLLLCYEARGFRALPLDASVARWVWGGDTLIPVVGGPLRHLVDDDLRLVRKVPVLTYPPNSHFGKLIAQTGLSDAFTASHGDIGKVDSAFSVLLLQLALRGEGVGWLPYTMCRSSLASGELVSLSSGYGSVPLNITLFALEANGLAFSVGEGLAETFGRSRQVNARQR